MWSIVRPDDDAYQQLFRGTLKQFYRGAQKFIGFLPTGRDPAGRDNLVTLFWSIAVKDVDAWHRNGLEAWKEDARGVSPIAEPVLEKITDPQQMLLAKYYRTHMYPYHLWKTAFIGDSSHAMNPVLGIPQYLCWGQW